MGGEHPGSLHLGMLMMRWSVVALSLTSDNIRGSQMLPNISLKGQRSFHDDCPCGTGSGDLMTSGEGVEVPKLGCFILFQQIAELFLEFIYLWKVYKLLERGFYSFICLRNPIFTNFLAPHVTIQMPLSLAQHIR